MAEKYKERVKELESLYATVSASHGNFGHFIRSQLARDALKKNNISALDLRYVTLQLDTQLYSFAEHWQSGIPMHVYSIRFEDHVPLPKASEEETSCARFVVTERPLRVLRVHRNLMIELCKKWVKGHDDMGHEIEHANSIDEASDLPSAYPRNLFQKKAGVTLIDYVFHYERSSSFHSVDGVLFDETVSAPSTAPLSTSRDLLLFGTEGLNLKQELIYPSKKKLRKSPDGFVSCVSEPSRPQAPPMKRGKSVNNPPVGSSPSPAGTPPPPPPHTYHSTRTPPPHHHPHPTPRERPGTPTLPEEKGEGLSKPPPKPTVQPRESTLNRDATPPKAPPPAPPPAPPSAPASPKVPNGGDNGHDEDALDTTM